MIEAITDDLVVVEIGMVVIQFGDRSCIWKAHQKGCLQELGAQFNCGKIIATPSSRPVDVYVENTLGGRDRS